MVHNVGQLGRTIWLRSTTNSLSQNQQQAFSQLPFACLALLVSKRSIYTEMANILIAARFKCINFSYIEASNLITIYTFKRVISQYRIDLNLEFILIMDRCSFSTILHLSVDLMAYAIDPSSSQFVDPIMRPRACSLHNFREHWRNNFRSSDTQNPPIIEVVPAPEIPPFRGECLAAITKKYKRR